MHLQNKILIKFNSFQFDTQLKGIMSSEMGPNFDEQFANINIKLKKRFMRKPNILEATNEFIALGIQCEHSDQPFFAGHAYVGAGKCEATTGNHLGEAEQYLAAARQFMTAEKKLKELKLFSPDRENLEASIGCYMHAFSKYPEDSTIRTSILMELAESLITLNHKKEALVYMEQALETVDDQTRKLIMTRNLLDLQIDCGQYDVALETANKLAETMPQIPEDILSEVQITRVLLALLTEPGEHSKPPSLKQLFTDLMNDAVNETVPFNTTLQLKLQSVIISCTISDVASLVYTAPELKRFLTMPQCNLLDDLVTEQQNRHLILS